MVKSIYASQFYKHSKRQKQITAALADPTNQGLVMQLAEALDEEYQKPEFLLDDEEQAIMEQGLNDKHTLDENPDVEDAPLEDDPKVSESSNVKKLGGKPSGLAPKPDSNESISSPEPSESSQSSESSESQSAETKEIKESTQVNISNSQGDILASTRAYFKDFHQLCDQIKGLLNLNGDTNGVNRILVKNNELQIFYEDSINLNDIMGDVIEILNAAGYTYLEFNRLMRSSNAIVFVINGKDTGNQVKSIATIEGMVE